MSTDINQINADKLTLINFSLKVVKKLLLEFQEYFPCATSINMEGEAEPVYYYGGDEQPPSTEIIAKYEEILDAKLNNKEIRSYSIAYDITVTTTKNNVLEKTDAIAILIKHAEISERSRYFYAYTLTPENELLMGESWGVTM